MLRNEFPLTDDCMAGEKKQLINPAATVLGKVMPVVIVIIFASILAPTYFFLLKPELNKYLPGGGSNIDTARELLDKRKIYAAQLRPLEDLYDEYGNGSQSNIIDTIVPSGLDIPTIYAIFERFGREMNVGVQSIDIGNLESASSSVQGVKSSIISMKMSGVGYEKMKEILHYLEVSMRLTDVTTVDFDPRGKFLSLTMRVYYNETK